MKYAIISADPAQPIQFEDRELGLRELQGFVGGNVEVISCGTLQMDFWANEDITGQDHDINHRATMIAKKVGSIHPLDYIGGDVVVTGLPDDDGDKTDLPQEAQERLERIDRSFQALVSVEVEARERIRAEIAQEEAQLRSSGQ